MRSQFMELKVQWPLANPDIFLSDTAALSCYELRPVGKFFKSIGISLHGRRNPSIRDGVLRSGMLL